MSSRVKNTKSSLPSVDALPITSEDDLLGPGDGNSKIGQKTSLKSTKSKPVKPEVEEVKENASNSLSRDVIESRDEKNFLLAQLHKKDDQIEKLSESVSCMTKEIQKLNNLIIKLQEQVVKSQENTSSTSKGVHHIPFSKVLQPEGKKNGSLSEKTPLAKVPSVPAKKTVKFADVVKRDLSKVSLPSDEVVLEIKQSCWKGTNLSYLLFFESGQEKWISSSECSSIQAMVDQFHKLNPGSPNVNDYSLQDSLKRDLKKKREIMSKIKKNQSKKLKADEIGFIANSLVKEAGKPKEFSKVSFSISNKRVFKGFTYAQKKNTLLKIIHQYGLNQKVVRISLVGDSILELYVISEEKETVTARMQSNGWTQVEFNPEDLPSFSSNKDEIAQKEALINRIAFLYAGTTLQNLKKLFIADLSESAKEGVLNRAKEIMDKRVAIKEGRAQAKLVPKSDL
jgi:hypothetical protein